MRESVDGIDAVEKAKTSKPDLILLDLTMPRLNGVEAAAVLKNEMPETPVHPIYDERAACCVDFSYMCAVVRMC